MPFGHTNLRIDFSPASGTEVGAPKYSRVGSSYTYSLQGPAAIGNPTADQVMLGDIVLPSPLPPGTPYWAVENLSDNQANTVRYRFAAASHDEALDEKPGDVALGSNDDIDITFASGDNGVWRYGEVPLNATLRGTLGAGEHLTVRLTVVEANTTTSNLNFFRAYLFWK